MKTRRYGRPKYGKSRKPFNNAAPRDVYAEITQKIIDLLAQGKIPWKKPWNSADIPTNLLTKRPYSGSNIMLLAFTPYASKYWIGYNQAIDLGGYVRKGEKATAIVKWNQKVIRDKETDEITVSYMYPVFLSVFNVEQCDGLNVPELETFQHNNVDCAEKVVKEMPNPPEIVEQNGQEASYNRRTDTVKMPNREQFPDIAEFYSTIFHELAHSTAHETRLNRPKHTGFGGTVYAKEELIAEIAASFLCARCSISQTTLENSAAYCQGWIKVFANDSKVFLHAAAAATRAAAYVTNEVYDSTDRNHEEKETS